MTGNMFVGQEKFSEKTGFTLVQFDLLGVGLQ
jgi:hypothetical protein